MREQAQGLGVRGELQLRAHPSGIERFHARQAPHPRPREPVRWKIAPAGMRAEPGKTDRDPATQRLAHLEQRRVADPQPLAIVPGREREHLRTMERNRANRRGRRQLDDLEPVADPLCPASRSHVTYSSQRPLHTEISAEDDAQPAKDYALQVIQCLIFRSSSAPLAASHGTALLPPAENALLRHPSRGARRWPRRAASTNEELQIANEKLETATAQMQS